MSVIDIHIHYSPWELISQRLAQLPSEDAKVTVYTDGIPTYTLHNQLHDLARHVRMMDHAGVDRAIISSAEGMTGDLQKCRVVNDDLSRQAQRFGGRIVGMAHTGTLAGPAGLEELDRAWDAGLKGLAIASTLGGRGLDNPELFPIYRHVQERSSFIFVHPTLACGTLGPDGFRAYDLFRTVGREFELIGAVLQLVCGGVLDEFPRLKIVMSHFGGGITSMVGRIRDYQDKAFWGLADDPIHGRRPRQDFDHYLHERLYFDTGGHFGEMTAVRAALLNIPARRLLFGTDYPQEIRDQEQVKAFVANLQAMDLSAAEIAGILGANAEAVMSGS
ncbi:MAG: amidohydrolase [Chloroflexota bacterium]|nr:amidohydrolase [Chloroflexota bacterium]